MDTPLCHLAQLALEVAGCVQMLTEAGHQILCVAMTNHKVMVSIGYSQETLKLNGRACGTVTLGGAQFFVYQKMIGNVLVRWMEPNHIQPTAPGVH